eukprot:CAMPEP_0172620616 /NCGR_PEP_ID=MMETSP1068-20121228/104709_1 /TAXON_ID=35684 /ORGANISM="Pseudopedinella elastica, Strain CCMP716" /LENGTH=63 /DNA_ID=CAMNT_0013427943 /DNA_START=8 /DNA_END=196 /DNA_ORIENTATION=+
MSSICRLFVFAASLNLALAWAPRQLGRRRPTKATASWPSKVTLSASSGGVGIIIAGAPASGKG